MQENYELDKAAKKKTAKRYGWMVLLLVLAFAVIVAKFALAGSLEDIITGMPSSDDVYTVAKDFVRPTLRSTEAQFSDSEYQFGKKADSVYVIKSSVTTKGDGGQEQKTDFEITLKYNGGEKTDQKNWELIDIKED
jgi:hypothetical protein